MKAHKKQRGKPARKDVVKTFDDTKPTNSQPAATIGGDLPPSHTKAEIAAVAAKIVCGPERLVPINVNIVPLAIAMAVELLDAADQAATQRDIQRAWLQSEGAAWDQMSFEDGVKIITGDASHLGRAKNTYRRFWEWRRWSLGRHNLREAELLYPEFAKQTSDGKKVTKEMREVMLDEGWFRQQAISWTPQSLAEEQALFDDWKKKGRPAARKQSGRPSAFDLRGNSPHPPPTIGRAKENGRDSGGTQRRLKK